MSFVDQKSSLYKKVLYNRKKCSLGTRKKVPNNRIFLITENSLYPYLVQKTNTYKEGRKSGLMKRFLITGNSLYPWFLLTRLDCIAVRICSQPLTLNAAWLLGRAQ